MTAPKGEPSSPIRVRWAGAVALVGLVLGLYGRTANYDFVNYDDHSYIHAEPRVADGLTVESVRWAFSGFQGANWHPLTSISYLLEVECAGIRPGVFHATNVVVHAANAVLLFLLLVRMTGRIGVGWLAAAVWAVHPQRVESVAWISERKDVLCGFFFLLALLAYTEYVRRPGARWYVLVAALFACGLMSKPALVPFPCLLLVLDYGLFGRGALGFRRLAVEKLPLLGLSAGSAAATVLAQKGVITAAGSFSWAAKLGNIPVAYVTYLGETIWPSDLAVLYPHPGLFGGPAGWEVIGALLVLVGLSAVAVRARDRYPYLLVGWLWFLGMLVPMIGLVQVGLQGHADRYTYLPQIGLVLAGTWYLAAVTDRWPRAWRVGLAAAAVAALSAFTWFQVGYWQNSETLFRRALDCAPANSMSHYCLFLELQQQGRWEEADWHLERAVNSPPLLLKALVAYGTKLAEKQQLDEGIRYLEMAVQIDPGEPRATHNLVVAYTAAADRLLQQNKPGSATEKKQLDEGIRYLEEAVRLGPGYPPATHNLAVAYTAAADRLVQQNKLGPAIERYRAALRLDPKLLEAHNNMGVALANYGRPDLAVQSFRAALAVAPDDAEAKANLRALLGADKK